MTTTSLSPFDLRISDIDLEEFLLAYLIELPHDERLILVNINSFVRYTLVRSELRQTKYNIQFLKNRIVARFHKNFKGHKLNGFTFIVPPSIWLLIDQLLNSTIDL